MKLRSQPEQIFLPLLIVLILSNCIIEHAESTERPNKPNVVLILTDDLGWQDVGCYDIDKPCPYDTPNINRLATQGVQFFQGYSPAPTCSPSRVAILSGKHPARSQKTHVVGGNPPTPYAKNSIAIEPWYSGRMKLSEITIAEALQANGYKTACVGKWHCAINHNAFPQPKDQGLDVQKRLEGRLNIRRIQQEFAESQPKTEWVDTDDLNDRKADDKVIHDLHYHQEGYRILGERFAKKSIGLIQQPSNQTSKKSP